MIAAYWTMESLLELLAYYLERMCDSDSMASTNWSQIVIISGVCVVVNRWYGKDIGHRQDGKRANKCAGTRYTHIYIYIYVYISYILVYVYIYGYTAPAH
jgi:hypothetical protein